MRGGDPAGRLQQQAQPQRRAGQAQQKAAAPAPPGTVRTERRVEKQRGGILGLRTVQTTVTETQTSRQCVDRGRSLERVHVRVCRRTTDSSGRLAEEEVRQSTVVEDHLGRVHSAHVTLHLNGRLVREAAALYLPAGLAGKAAQSGLAATVPAALLAGDSLKAAAGSGRSSAAGGTNGGLRGRSDSAGMKGYAGGGMGKNASAAAAAAPVRAVGYVYEGGEATWGLISDPAAVGLPLQQPGRMDRVRPPPWQVLPATPE
ncbi:hypothetical protein ABPG75_000791 [Micractinium tetrahymenae]